LLDYNNIALKIISPPQDADEDDDDATVRRTDTIHFLYLNTKAPKRQLGTLSLYP